MPPAAGLVLDLEMNGVVQKVGVAVEKGEDDTCQQAGDSER